jgi:hypothetical protein
MPYDERTTALQLSKATGGRSSLRVTMWITPMQEQNDERAKDDKADDGDIQGQAKRQKSNMETEAAAGGNNQDAREAENNRNDYLATLDWYDPDDPLQIRNPPRFIEPVWLPDPVAMTLRYDQSLEEIRIHLAQAQATRPVAATKKPPTHHSTDDPEPPDAFVDQPQVGGSSAFDSVVDESLGHSGPALIAETSLTVAPVKTTCEVAPHGAPAVASVGGDAPEAPLAEAAPEAPLGEAAPEASLGGDALDGPPAPLVASRPRRTRHLPQRYM